ncbi:uncharacterized mitochondrial protein AtMg00240-like [Pyrus communis]|uniref:uncharacterized mitochondrial protein AtMg00240-like n=1 Tax=Pyrus communis TaxID=23211 RepID=UPI0035BED7E3
MDGAKPCITPLGSTKLDLTGSLLDNPEEYRSIVGALQYLTWTRPDLSFAVNLVCQFMHSPREPHFQAVKRILRYLKGTLGYDLWFPKTSTPLTLKAYSDVDWAGCSWDRCSTGGFFKINLLTFIPNPFQGKDFFFSDPSYHFNLLRLA